MSGPLNKGGFLIRGTVLLGALWLGACQSSVAELQPDKAEERDRLVSVYVNPLAVTAWEDYLEQRDEPVTGLGLSVADALQRHHSIPYVLELEISLIPRQQAAQDLRAEVRLSFFGQERIRALRATSRLSPDGEPLRVESLYHPGPLEPALVVPLSGYRSGELGHERQGSAPGSASGAGLDRPATRSLAAGSSTASNRPASSSHLDNPSTNSPLSGRLSGNRLAFHFGEQEGLLPARQRITLLVLVDEPEQLSNEQHLRITASTTLHNPVTGKIFHGIGEEDRLERTERELARTGFPLERDRIRLLLQAFELNDFDRFSDLLRQGDSSETDPATLWKRLDHAQSLSGYRVQTVDLPKVPEIHLPPSQAVILFDDGRQVIRAGLVGGYGLDRVYLDAMLHLKLEDGSLLALPATAVEVGREGRHPVFRFPSLSLWGIRPARDGRRLIGAHLEYRWLIRGSYDRRYLKSTPVALTSSSLFYHLEDSQ
ncbi:hypothetical protein [Kiloniella sp. b19]|uniref:hypothetical protein n=1 Tax=Kiloniella sp. GXU_MW_B19 TaxID=3141326 RepID=UPI0031DFB01A